MKNTILLLAIASSMIASCKKEEVPTPAIAQTMEVNLRTGESYTFSLPKNLRNDPYEITTQAKHASISELGVNSSGEQIYKYTPELNYSGSDQVIVSNDKECSHNCAPPQGPPPAGAGHGDCNSEKEDHYIVTINFTMEDSTVPVSK